MTSETFSSLCRQIRKDTVQIFLNAGGGHLGSALSMVEILATLYHGEMKLKEENFLLSKGHGCLSLYAVLGRLGYFSTEEWKLLGTPAGILGGHPTSGKIPGVEISTGSLGLAPSVAVGMAAAEKLKKSTSRVFCLLGDGELNEGSVWEAALSAKQNGLGNLYFLVDCNGLQAFGPTSEVWNLEPLTDKWRAFGWETFDVDLKKNPLALRESLGKANASSETPKIFLCRTRKGMGLPVAENNPAWHNKTRLTGEERAILEEYVNS